LNKQRQQHQQHSHSQQTHFDEDDLRSGIHILEKQLAAAVAAQVAAGTGVQQQQPFQLPQQGSRGAGGWAEAGWLLQMSSSLSQLEEEAFGANPDTDHLRCSYRTLASLSRRIGDCIGRRLDLL
jgi:hypothetical protein